MTGLEQQFVRMRSGQMHNDPSPEPVSARKNAVLLTNVYNTAFAQPDGEQEEIFRRLWGSVGLQVRFESAFRCGFGRNIHIGGNVYANFDCVMPDAAEIIIGNRVWTGAGSHLNPDVSIGDDSIIGSGSVVTEDIPPGGVAADVPCTTIRAITRKDSTEFSL